MSAPEPDVVDLRDHMIAALAPEPDRFRVSDKGSADWAARLILKAEDSFAADCELANRQIAAVREWLYGRRVQRDMVRDRWRPELIEWHRSERNIDHKGRAVNASILLPCGMKLVSSKKPDRTEITDEAAFVQWAKTQDEQIRAVILNHKPQQLVPESWTPLKAGIKKALTSGVADGEPGPYVTAEGEVAPGVYAQPGDVDFDIELPTPKDGE